MCSIFVFAVFAISLPYEAFSGPAYDGLFEIRQPSGNIFKAKKRGDERHRWVETEDGYGIYKNRKTNCWEYYLPSNDPEKQGLGIKGSENDMAVVGDTDPASRNIPKRLRPAKIKKPESFSEKTEMYRQEKTQKAFERKSKSTAVSGTMKLLVIGVQFEDHPATYSADDIQLLLFGESSSIADYFNDVSYGAVTIESATESHGTSNDGFIGWLQLSGNHPNTGSDQDFETDKQTAENAMVAASDYIDYASYDADGDGYIEPTELAVLIIVAGYAAETGDYEPSVWGHKSGKDFELDGKYVDGYAMVGEKHGDHSGTIGVMVHELGHLIFDLPDLYDTDKDTGDSYGIGYFGLMGSGGWGAKYGENAGSSPTHPCAWSKEYLSWGTVNTITSSQMISAPKADGNSSSVFRLDTSDPDQYFLIENRQFSGYDIGFQRNTGSSGHGGAVIYHIDTSKTDMWPGSNDVNADEDDKGVDVEEANEGSVGYSMLDTYEKAAHTNMFYFSGNNDSFSNSTTPNSRLKNNNATHISITGISSYGDTMSAYVTRPPTATTGSVTNLASDSATLNGTVNPYGEETTVWFEYGATSGSYSNTTSTQNVSGTGEISVSSDISGLTEGITYYYRIVAQNSIGTIYGDEKSFESFVSITTTPMVAGGVYHSMALKSDGTVWTWGYNSDGQLGDGGTTDRYTPVQVSGLSGVTGIAAGSFHNLVLKSDGTVWAWGDNLRGQLGDGTTENRYTPVQVDINLGTSPDTFVPSGTVQINNGDDYTNSTTVTLKLLATDDTGVTGYYLSTSSKAPISSDPGWTTVSSTTNYSASVSYTLSTGDGSKTIYVWYKDAAVNISSTASDSITLDTTAPTVSITSPTSDTTYSTTISTINLSGSASDSTSGVSSVAWSNTTTGISGTANGTTSWSVSGIKLSGGDNAITITATDNAGNTSTDTLTVTYNGTTLPTPAPTPTPSTGGNTGSLELSKSQAYLDGDSIVVTVTDADLNISGTKNYTTVNVTSSAEKTSVALTLTETASNSTTFTGTFSTAKSTDSTTSPVKIKAVAGGYITVKYSDANPGSDITKEVTTKNFGAYLYITADEIAIDGNATVSLYDPESNTSITLTNNVNIKIRSSSDSTGTTLSLTETGKDTGSFYGTINVSSNDTEKNNNILADVGDSITVSFTDDPDGYGDVTVVTDTATVIDTSSTSETGTVYGFVTYTDTGLGMAGATVSSSTGAYSDTTDSTGNYQITGIPAGSYTFTASASGYTSEVTGVTVTAGETTTLDFGLSAAVPTSPTPPPPIVTPTPETATLVVAVAGEDGSIAGATVTVDGQSGVTDASGGATFTLEAGDYTVSVSATDYLTSVSTVTVMPPVTLHEVTLEKKVCPEPDAPVASTATVTPESLSLAKGDSEDVIVLVTDDNGCPAAGVKVKKKVSSANNKKVSVSPTSATTDASGQVAFTIKAKKNKGYATVKFKVDGVKVKPKVKVALTK